MTEQHSNVVSCEAGVILASLETALNDHQMTIPIDLGAKVSKQPDTHFGCVQR